MGEKKRWLKPGQEPDLTKVVDVAIDGDLWTLDESGKIRRFRQGEQIDYIVKNLEKPLGKAAALVIPTDSEYVYVLDQENKRVVVVDKKGGIPEAISLGWFGGGDGYGSRRGGRFDFGFVRERYF